MEQNVRNIVETYNSLIFPVWQKKHANMILRIFDRPRLPIKALEINCRNGYLTYEIAKRVPDKSSIIAIDSSRDMLKFAMEVTLPFQNVIYFKKDSEVSNFDKGVFDYVFLANSNINKHSRKSVEKIKEFLSDGGALISTFVNRGGFEEFFKHFLDVLKAANETEYMIGVEDALNNQIGRDEIDEVFASYQLDVLRSEQRTISLNFESSSTLFAMPYFYFILLPIFKYSVSLIPEWMEITERIKDILIEVLSEKGLNLTAEISCVIASKPVI